MNNIFVLTKAFQWTKGSKKIYLKKLFFLFHVFSICCLFANAQQAGKEAPKGFGPAPFN
jgi:hypothetical protein